MISTDLTDYTETLEYRNRLAKALEVARQRLSARDFEGLSKGLESEIARLDSELAEYYDVLPSTKWTALYTKAIPFEIQQTSSIRLNSFNWRFAPWKTPQCEDRDCAFAATAGGGF